MKRIPLMMAALAMLLLVACKGKEEAKMEAIAASDFNVVAVMTPVKDVDKWKVAYMAHDSVRRAYGLETFTMGKGVDDPSMVYVTNKFKDAAKAKEFMAMPELKTMMDSAGVTGAPMVNWAHVIRMDTTAANMSNMSRLRIEHHVKDFDAWLKVYDGEGREARAANGMVDRSLARGIEDPNMVYITFYITDMEKAKTRGASPEMKKLMTDAGVDSEPKFFMYTAMK